MYDVDTVSFSIMISKPFCKVGAINKREEINWELMSPLILTKPPNNFCPIICNGAVSVFFANFILVPILFKVFTKSLIGLS